MTFQEILVKEIKTIHAKKEEVQTPKKEMSYAEHMHRLSAMNPQSFVHTKGC